MAEAAGAEGARGSVGPEVPTDTGDTRPSSHAAQTPTPQRRLRQPRLRERRVHPRYSDSEFTDLAHAAALSRMQIGGYVAEASLAAARAEDPTAAIADYRAMVKALMAANRQLGGLGNNLNQLTWHLNKDGAWPEPDVVHRLLARVEASIADVDTAVAQVTEGRHGR
ncbi:plasmid mobilization relaxosome protein MobC [Streptomyces sp. NBC_00847]|uniref:plasmid mobilization protein n=1 Tax=Streptomyces sp. NBC_00847 TaxID=2975850 RepID=UPI0022573067|nr:plasmid mobilization relaxosome protein MobC [Streptomyces sp. NBC_00847]MCX4881443.1 MobC family plasmid mobilization relaxosome protein [Streptomyces sp. NBC_00847]